MPRPRVRARKIDPFAPETRAYVFPPPLFQDAGVLRVGEGRTTDGGLRGPEAQMGAGAQVVMNVMPVVQAAAPDFTDCLERTAAPSGSYQLTLDLGAEGNVRSSTVAGGAGASEATTRCLAGVAGRLRFSRPVAAGIGVTIPINWGAKQAAPGDGGGLPSPSSRTAPSPEQGDGG
jgi:hypothetical protein